mmetsp:Transcript_32391/g.76861  ORF Transcript_32391/g.76861 Transcript_32391/m.76861 type:complete len:890 (-) Transcript_32391:73-2742(-)
MSLDLPSIESEEEEARRQAQGVLDDIQALVDQVRGIHATGGSKLQAALEQVRDAKGEAKALVQMAGETAMSLQKLSRQAALVKSSESKFQAEKHYLDVQVLVSKLYEDANYMRDVLDRVYDGMMDQDRRNLVERHLKATENASQHVSVTFSPEQRRPRLEALGPPAPPEDRLMVIASTKFTKQSSAEAQAPQNMPPIGVAMAGEPDMPIGWSIPGDSSGHWMWAQFTIINTSKMLLLPIRRCTTLELMEAMGKMLGRSHEDFKLFVKQGPLVRKLGPADFITSKVLVKGITSWERQKQQYNHPFAIVGAGHLGLRQALECIKQKIEDFVLFDRLDQVGGEAWHRVANSTSRLQSESGTYHLAFDSSYPAPKGMATWPSREDILRHFQTSVSEYGILPHIQLKTNVSGLKIEKMSRLQMLEEGKGDSDPNSQHYKLALQHQPVFEGLSCRLKEEGKKDGKAKKGAKKADKKAAEEPPAEEGAGGGGGAAAGPEKSAFLASGVMAFPGSFSVPREEVYKGEELFGGPIVYGMGDEFDYDEAKGKLIAICGMGSLAFENLQTCLEKSAKSCYMVCRRKNLALPRAVSWFINQSAFPPTAAEVLSAMLPMYNVANDEPWGYYAVSPDASLIQQTTRFPISDFAFLALYYGRAEVVVGDVKRLLHQMVMLEDGRKLEVNCLIKAFGFTASFDFEAIMHSSKMFGFWPDADFRRWIYCESPGVDFMNINTTGLSPMAMRVATLPLHFLAFPKPDFKELVDAGSMHWNSPDTETNQPAYVLNARDATYVISLVVAFAPKLQEIDYEAVKRKRQLQCQPAEAFIKEASAEWTSYCKLLTVGTRGLAAPTYPYSLDSIKDMTSKNDKDGKKRMATASTVDPQDGGPTRTWSPFMKMYC